MYKKLILLLSVFAIALLFLAGCGEVIPVRVSELYDQTHKYQNKEIYVRGEVSTSISVLGLSGFLLSDGSYELIVVGYDLSPSPGNMITVKGRLSVPFRLHDQSLLVLKASPKKKGKD